MIMLLGRVPSIGIYIHMSLNVLKTLSVFLIVYSPLLIAFAATFFILLPTKAQCFIFLKRIHKKYSTNLGVIWYHFTFLLV